MLEQTQSIISSLMVPKLRCLACLGIRNGPSIYIRLESSIKPNETQNRTQAFCSGTVWEEARVCSVYSMHKNRHPLLLCGADGLGKAVRALQSGKNERRESDTHKPRENFHVSLNGNERHEGWTGNPQRKEREKKHHTLTSTGGSVKLLIRGFENH